MHALQVEANKELNGVTAEGANVLPAQVIEDAFRHQYNKTLNFTDLKAGMQKVDSWYADRGIFGQVGAVIIFHMSIQNMGSLVAHSTMVHLTSMKCKAIRLKPSWYLYMRQTEGEEFRRLDRTRLHTCALREYAVWTQLCACM